MLEHLRVVADNINLERLSNPFAARVATWNYQSCRQEVGFPELEIGSLKDNTKGNTNKYKHAKNNTKLQTTTPMKWKGPSFTSMLIKAWWQTALSLQPWRRQSYLKREVNRVLQRTDSTAVQSLPPEGHLTNERGSNDLLRFIRPNDLGAWNQHKEQRIPTTYSLLRN
jgi:hypothetical protein